jgi:hypothetical protein
VAWPLPISTDTKDAKYMKKIVLILLTLFPVTSFGATYYVSKSGNNTNPGTLSQPWATIQKAASTLVAGDTVYVRGGIYYEQVTPANSGTDDSKITYAMYSAEIPIIDGTGVSPKSASWGGLFNIVGGKSHIIVKGFTIRNTASISATPGLAGVLIDGGHDVTVTQCSINNTRSSGIGVWNSTNTSNLKTYITHNDIQQAVNGGSQECLSIAESSYVDLSYNSVHNGVNLDTGGEGINVKGGVSYIDIHHNKVYDLPGEVSIYVDAYNNTLSNVDVYANEVYDSGYGIGLACEQGGTINGVNIYNNVVRKTASNGIEITSYGGGQRNNIKIFNNTVYGNRGGINVAPTAITNIEIYNNISASNSNYQLQVASTANITTSYNLWYGTQGTYKGTNYLTNNPLFVETTDLHLQNLSPAIDAGTKGPNTDKDGAPRPQGSGYDMGAYEYGDNGPPKAPTALRILN